MAVPATNLFPPTSFDMLFSGLRSGFNATFKVTEPKESRNLDGSYDVTYDAFLDPVRDILFTNYVWTAAEREAQEYISDELIIAWNVWEAAGWSYYNKTLIKKWPPHCTRVSNNSYKVTIRYAPLYDLNFQITPSKIKRKSAIWTEQYNFDDEGGIENTGPENVEGDEERTLYLIGVDKKGKVQGVNVFEHSIAWTERWTWGPQEQLLISGQETSIYLALLAKHTSTLNEKPFRGLPKGSVLFVGSSTRYVTSMKWEIDYRFMYKPPKKFVELGFIKVPIPEFLQSGWTFVDLAGDTTTIENEKSGDRKFLAEKIESIKLHIVYETTNFDDLKLYSGIVLGNAKIWEDDELLGKSPSIGQEALPLPFPLRPKIENKSYVS